MHGLLSWKHFQALGSKEKGTLSPVGDAATFGLNKLELLKRSHSCHRTWVHRDKHSREETSETEAERGERKGWGDTAGAVGWGEEVQCGPETCPYGEGAGRGSQRADEASEGVVRWPVPSAEPIA